MPIPTVMALSVLAEAATAQVSQVRIAPARSSVPTSVVVLSQIGARVGASTGSSPFEDFDHRNGFLTAFPWSSGGTLVLDGTRVVAFNASGKRQWTFGRDGDGPGEFRMVWRGCSSRGDTVVVMDNAHQRITVLSNRGTLIRSFSMVEKGSMTEHACRSDGRILTERSVRSHRGGPMKELLAVDFAGRASPLAVRYVGDEMLSPVKVPLSIGVEPQGFYVADPRTNTVRMYQLDGKYVGGFTSRDPRRAFSEADAKRYPTIDSRDGSPPPRSVILAGSMWPAFSDVVSSGLHFWIREPRQGREASSVWTVVGRDGTPIARYQLKLPGVVHYSKLLAVRADRVLFLWRDDGGEANIAWFKNPLP